MKRLFEWFKRISESIRVGIYRFPVTVACAAAIMIISLILLHEETGLLETVKIWLTRVAFTLGLGIPASVALRLWIERRAGRLLWLKLICWAGFLLLLAYYLFFLMPVPPYQTMQAAVRYMGLMLAAVTLVVAIPYLSKETGDERFALKLFWRLFITVVFTGILIGGVSLVLLMLEKLLGVNIGDKAYMDNVIACFGLFAPSFFLAGVPMDRDAPKTEPYQPLIKILLGYIIFPLLGIYTAIVYAFFIRILILWDWPSNMMVNMVLWYTAVGVLALYFLRSQSETNRWFRFFDRWYPRFTVLPILLMFVGMVIRIIAYGFTVPRVLVLVMAVWVTVLTVHAILVKPERRLNLVAPTLLVALALLTVLGPWNAFNIAQSSQNARLNALLERNNMLTSDGLVTQGSGVSEADQREIYAVLDYFSENDTTSDVPSLVDLPVDGDYAAVLGFQRPTPVVSPDMSVYHNIGIDKSNTSPIDINGFDYLFTNTYGVWGEQTGQGLTITMGENNSFIVIKDGQTLYNQSLDAFILKLDENYIAGKTYTQDELTIIDENDNVRVKILFQYVFIDYTNPEQPVCSMDGFIALVDIK